MAHVLHLFHFWQFIGEYGEKIFPSFFDLIICKKQYYLIWLHLDINLSTMFISNTTNHKILSSWK